MEVSQVRKQLLTAMERGRRDAQERRQRTAEAERAFGSFLNDVAIPIARTLGSTLKSEGLPFTISTPGGSVRLSSDNARNDYIDILLDATADPPEVVARSSRGRGSRTLNEERAVKPGAAPGDISEQELLDFLLGALAPWLER